MVFIKEIRSWKESRPTPNWIILCSEGPAEGQVGRTLGSKSVWRVCAEAHLQSISTGTRGLEGRQLTLRSGCSTGELGPSVRGKSSFGCSMVSVTRILSLCSPLEPCARMLRETGSGRDVFPQKSLKILVHKAALSTAQRWSSGLYLLEHSQEKVWVEWNYHSNVAIASLFLLTGCCCPDHQY